MLKNRVVILCLVFILSFPSSYAQKRTTLQNLPIFVDVTKQTGINFVHSFGDKHLSSISLSQR